MTWGVWTVASAATLGFVLTRALTVPFADEWQWVSVAGRAEPVTWAWLWSQHNEHRPALARLTYLALARLTGYDFRAAAVLNVAILAALAAAMIRSARALRGRGSVADAFFPLMLLHWAQFTNLLWGFQLCLVMSSALGCAGLLAMLRATRDTWLRWGLVATACCVAATLSAAAGLAWLAAVAIWLVGCAALRFRDGAPGQLIATAALVILIASFGAVYMAGFQTPNAHPAPRAVLPAVRTAFEFLANAFGPVAEKTWPISAVVVGAACAWAAGHALKRMRVRPEDRPRALGLLCFLLGMFGLAAAVGWSRWCLGPGAGFEPRYVTLSVPLACLFYLQSAALVGPWSSRIQWALLAVAAVLLVPNSIRGLHGAANLQAAAARLVADARSGIPPRVLAVRYLAGSGFSKAADMASRLAVLRQGGWGPYRGSPAMPVRDSLEIGPIATLADSASPARIVPVAAGQPVAGWISVPGDVVLERIDLRARHRPRGGPQGLRWELSEAREGGRLLRCGEVDLAQLDHHDWLTIRPAPLELRGGQRLWLRLVAQGVAGARPLEVPLYEAIIGAGESDAPLSFQGFLYYTPRRAEHRPLP